jgi:hypothetical protein
MLFKYEPKLLPIWIPIGEQIVYMCNEYCSAKILSMKKLSVYMCNEYCKKL